MNSSRSAHPPRRGFILATSLLVLTLLTVMLTAAFILISAEFRTTDNATAGARALALAEAGLEDYLTQYRGLSQTHVGDSVRITMLGGYADVVGERIRPPMANTVGIWSIRSTGVTNDPLLIGTPRARRTIARLAYLYPGNLPARAALTALNGVYVWGSGATNPIDGNNAVGAFGTCVLPGGAAEDTVGLAASSNGIQPAYGHGGTPWPLGEGTNGMQIFGLNALYDSTHINWVALRDPSGENFAPDYLLPAGPLPPANAANLSFFVYYAPGNYTLPGNGSDFPNDPRRGVLVVGGNLTVSNEVHWDGVVLVGGRLIIQGSYIFHGQVITGLNLMLSPSQFVGPDTLYRANSTFPRREIEWSYCYVNLSSDALSGFSPIRRTWTDSWALY